MEEGSILNRTVNEMEWALYAFYLAPETPHPITKETSGYMLQFIRDWMLNTPNGREFAGIEELAKRAETRRNDGGEWTPLEGDFDG